MIFTSIFTFIKGKLTLILLLAIVVLSVTVFIQKKKIVQTMGLYSTSVANEKASNEGLIVFKDKYNREHAKTRTYTKTVREFETSNNVLENKLLQVIKESKIKTKDVTQAAIIQTTINTTLTDTIYQAKEVFPDTIVNLSTPNITNVITIKDKKITSQVALTNEQSLITSFKKETIKPRCSFFLFRWFQKKHVVGFAEVINSNPLIQTTEQRFVLFPENIK